MQEAVNLVDRFMGIGWATARKPREVLALLALLVRLTSDCEFSRSLYGHRVGYCTRGTSFTSFTRCTSTLWASGGRARKPRSVLALLALLALLLLEKYKRTQKLHY